MKTLSSAAKIGLVFVSFVIWCGLRGVTDDFSSYRVARATNLANRIHANMLMVRMNVKVFLATCNKYHLHITPHFSYAINY